MLLISSSFLKAVLPATLAGMKANLVQLKSHGRLAAETLLNDSFDTLQFDLFDALQVTHRMISMIVVLKLTFNGPDQRHCMPVL